MIVSVEQEEAWLKALHGLPAWIPPSKQILIVAPHPDDETLGAGGLIAAQRRLGVDVIVAAVTDGENAYPENEGLGDLRRREQTEALSCLGVPKEKIVRFELPDSAVASQGWNLVEQLTSLVGENTHIVAPWHCDFHPDHEACGRAAEKVAQAAGATLSSYFFWTWHFGTVALLNNLRLQCLPLDEQSLAAKANALRCHRSQLERAIGEPILPERLLAPARRRFEVFATA